MSKLNKKEFMYQCCLHAMQGSFANPAGQLPAARIVREAEKLWNELQEWETLQERDESNLQ